MKPYHTISLIFILIIASLSCNRNSKIEDRLHIVDNLIESHPDSALALLNSINPDSITSRKEHAKYSLLMSMALDKNYIDTTDFSILKPAIEYYANHGAPNAKLRTLYYQGRIYMNRRENDQAMRSFVQSLDLADQCTDTLTIARILVAQALIFIEVYNLDSYTNNYLKAAELFKQKKDYHQYSNCILQALNGSLLLNEKELSDSLIILCYSALHRNFLNIEEFFPYQLSYFDKKTIFHNLLIRSNTLHII